MLYVNRYIGRKSFGVVDTDDWVETEVDMAKALEVIFGHNLTIQGINSLSSSPVGLYQPEHTKTQLQLKAKMLLHTDVFTWKGSVVGVIWDNNALDSQVTLRLSDFGKSLGDFILRGNWVSKPPKVILQFDDSIKPVSPLSLQPLTAPVVAHGEYHDYMVCVDLSRVMDDELAYSVYRCMLQPSGIDPSKVDYAGVLEKYIIDNKNRKWRIRRWIHNKRGVACVVH